MVKTSRIVNNFMELARLDSLSREEKKVADFLVDNLKSLGVHVGVDETGKKIGGDTGNVIVHVPGDSQFPTLIFSAHMDTVEPGRGIEPALSKGVIRSEGETILGADDKAGVVAVLELAYVLKENEFPHGDIFLIFTVAEEIGLLGAKNLDMTQLGAKYAYVIDGDGKVGGIVVKAPSQNYINATFKGRASHAGVSPEAGINSIQAAALAISKMKLGRISKGTTANIGVIRGGLASNIIPQETRVEGEARSFSLGKLNAQTGQMKRHLINGAKAVRAKVDVEIKRAYDGFSFTKRSKIAKFAMEAMKKIDLEPRLFSSGGGSDANVFNKVGVPAINISVGAENAHTVQEQLVLEELEKLAQLLPEIIRTISGG